MAGWNLWLIDRMNVFNINFRLNISETMLLRLHFHRTGVIRTCIKVGYEISVYRLESDELTVMTTPTTRATCNYAAFF